MNFVQRMKNTITSMATHAAIDAAPYLANLSYVVGGLLMAPYMRRLFDVVMDNLTGYTAYTTTPMYSVAREAIGYFGSPIILKTGLNVAKKGAEIVFTKASEKINEYAARINEQGPSVEEMPDFSSNNANEHEPSGTEEMPDSSSPYYADAQRLHRLLESDPIVQQYVKECSEQTLRKFVTIYQRNPQKLMQTLEAMNSATRLEFFTSLRNRG